MNILEITDLNPAQKEAIFHLWNGSYPKKINYAQLADFETYLNNLDEKQHYLLIDARDNIEGWCCSFRRTGRTWFAIIVNASVRGKGYGTRLLNAVRQGRHVLWGWVIDHDNDVLSNGELYRSPLPFYVKNDFVVCPDIRLETEQISAVAILWARDE